ncbi:hypothetical protein V8B97DRAFT_1915666 [Scleroderma yunnanense]
MGFKTLRSILSFPWSEILFCWMGMQPSSLRLCIILHNGTVNALVINLWPASLGFRHPVLFCLNFNPPGPSPHQLGTRLAASIPWYKYIIPKSISALIETGCAVEGAYIGYYQHGLINRGLVFSAVDGLNDIIDPHKEVHDQDRQ